MIMTVTHTLNGFSVMMMMIIMASRGRVKRTAEAEGCLEESPQELNMNIAIAIRRILECIGPAECVAWLAKQTADC